MVWPRYANCSTEWQKYIPYGLPYGRNVFTGKGVSILCIEMCSVGYCRVGMYLMGHCGKDVPTV